MSPEDMAFYSLLILAGFRAAISALLLIGAVFRRILLRGRLLLPEVIVRLRAKTPLSL